SSGERSEAALSESRRTPQSDAYDNRRYRRSAQNHSSELAEDALYRLPCSSSQAANKTCTKEDFRGQTAHHRKRCFWSRGGYRFSGSCLGKQGCERRYNCCLGRCREVHTCQPLAPTNGC